MKATHATIALAALALLRCGGGESSDDGSGQSGGNGGSSASSSGGQGGSIAVDGSGGSSASGGSAADGGTIDKDAACVANGQTATLVPVNMYIMFDDSGSMRNNDKWTNATAALTAFFQDPGTAGLRIALRFFPDDNPTAGCTDDDCNAAACRDPLVPLGGVLATPAPADAQEKKLVDAVANQSTANGGGTPMFAALDGAARFTKAYQQAHPTEKTVVVLVTDGAPNGCDEDIADIAALATDARTTRGVLTYAVGMEGSRTDDMNQIATAGGTGQGIFIGAGNAQAELLAALKAIQGSQVACEFQFPTSGADGGVPDPTKINVNYTSGSNEERVGQVTGPGNCSGGGWYYDNPTQPTTITFCPSTCTEVQADPNADIEILIGCSTQVQPPPS